MSARQRLRAVLLERLDALGVFERLRARHRTSVTVLQYHGVTASGQDKGTSFRRKHVDVERFTRQMQWIRERYNVVSLDRVIAHYREGTPLPDFPAALTFDDGFRNNYAVAYPILSALALPATIFVPTDFISGKGSLWLDRIEYALYQTGQPHLVLDILRVPVALRLTSDRERTESKKLLKNLLRESSPDLIASVVAQLEARAGAALGGDRHAQGDYAPLTGDELGEMHGSGLISVGSHTVTHPILPRCSPAQLEAELTVSKRTIESLLGHACRLFCYPNGEVDAPTKAAVARAGYAGAVCSRAGLNARGADVFALTRLGIPGTLPMAEFAALVSGGLFLLRGLRSRVVPV